MAKVNVVVNCYNGEEYLEEALRSIKEQSYQDYEVIFIDNCSTDNSAAIAKSFGLKLRYYKTDKLISLGEGRNYAIEKCDGEYITFLDCDDLWERDKLKIQTALMDKEPQCITTMSNIYMLNMINGTKTVVLKDSKIRRLSLDEFAINYEYGMSSFMIRNSTVKALGLKFDNRLSYAEEYDFFLRLACYGKVIYIPDILATYRVHSTMNSKKLKETIPEEYNVVLNNLRGCKEEISNEYPTVFAYLEFLRDYTQAKIFIEKRENVNARKTIRPYVMKNKKALAYYALSFLPMAVSSKIYCFFYKQKVV